MTAPKKNALIDAMEKLTSNRRSVIAKKPVPQMSLDLWPDAVRGVPNAVLRGALFSVSQRRTWADRELVASVEGMEIRFKGQRFNQTDLDLWEMLVHLARQQPLGNRVDFTAHALLKALGRGTGQSQHKQLHDEIVRLRGGTAEITWIADKKTFIGGMISQTFKDEETGRYVVILDPKMQTLYQSGYSQVDWGQRQALGNNNLSKWLHGFYSSHAQPFPYKVKTIKDLCGSTSKDLRDFRRMLKASLDDLIEVGLIVEWSISERDLVAVSKVPTPSQQKHIEKRRQAAPALTRAAAFIPAPAKEQAKAGPVPRASRAPTAAQVTAKATTKAPAKAPAKTTTKAPAKATTKTPAKATTKAPAKATAKATTKTPAKATTKAPAKTPAKATTRAPAKVTTQTPRARRAGITPQLAEAMADAPRGRRAKASL